MFPRKTRTFEDFHNEDFAFHVVDENLICYYCQLIRSPPFIMATKPTLPGFVLVEANEDIPLDNAVVPAVLEFIIGDVIKRHARALGLEPPVIIVSMDRPVSEYSFLLNRLSIPKEHLLDGFSQWYAGTSEVKVDTECCSEKKVHVGSYFSGQHGAQELTSTLQSVLSSNTIISEIPPIVVLDSISSILYTNPEMASALSIYHSMRKLFCPNTMKGNAGTLIFTLFSSREDKCVVKSLRKMADTVVSVSQQHDEISSLVTVSTRGKVILNARKRKPSGRVHFETHEGRLSWSKRLLYDIKSSPEVGFSLRSGVEPGETEDDLADKLNKFGLSFRVGLSSKEKEVRAAAGLPYLHNNEKLADSALTLHPRNLQVDRENDDMTENPREDLEDCSDSDSDELFSEDV